MTRQAAQQRDDLELITHSPSQTSRIGQRLGELLRPGDLVLLFGDFGVGKTHLTKGLALGLGSADLVTSPSFVLVNEYRAGAQHQHATIYHADLYRLDSAAELSGIGLDEALMGDGICIVEWANRATAQLPDQRLELQMRHLSETKRVIRLVPYGERFRTIVQSLKASSFA